jgi:hypothetical protein
VDYDTRGWQFRLLATVYHGPAYGHYLEMETLTKGRRDPLRTGLGRWNGVGIPEDVLRTAGGIILATWDEHLITRYGVKGELPLTWKAEADPF